MLSLRRKEKGFITGSLRRRPSILVSGAQAADHSAARILSAALSRRSAVRRLYTRNKTCRKHCGAGQIGNKNAQHIDYDKNQ